MNERIDGALFLARAKEQEGKDYVWNTDGPNTFDCSGLVDFCILLCGGPDWRATGNCRALFGYWRGERWIHGLLEELYPGMEEAYGRGKLPLSAWVGLEIPVGTLVFYGQPGVASHVMIVADHGPASMARVFGAAGGNRSTLMPTDGACVQWKPSIRYRPDVLGFRRLPLRAL